jgi:hypothetical protein
VVVGAEDGEGEGPKFNKVYGGNLDRSERKAIVMKESLRS